MGRVSILLLGFVLLLAPVPPPVLAAEPRQGDTVVIGPNEIIADDLYAFGRTVDIQGTVRGDVVAFASVVTVSGVVTGDLIVGAGTTTVTGEVGGSIRVGSGNVTVDGPVGGDLLVGGGSASLGPKARVGRDLLLGSTSATVDGQVGRNVLAGAGNLTLNGQIGGDVRAEVGSLRLTDRAAVGGNLTYTSDQEATIASGAAVRGNVERHQPEQARVERRPLDAIITWLRTLVGMFALGLVLVLLFPDFSRHTVSTLGRSPWASLGLGLGLLIGVPIVALILFVVGLLVGGWWLAFVALAVYAIAVALSFVVVGLFAGRWLLDRASRPGVPLAWALLLGLALLLLVSVVPILGAIVAFLAILFGLGALALAVFRARQTIATSAG